MNERQIIPSLHERLIKFAAAGRAQAEAYPSGPLRESLLDRVRAVETNIEAEGRRRSADLVTEV